MIDITERPRTAREFLEHHEDALQADGRMLDEHIAWLRERLEIALKRRDRAATERSNILTALTALS